MMDVETHLDHRPDPDNPGWSFWNMKDDRRFNANTLGHMITRLDAPGKARLRMFPTIRHSNLQDAVHGGVILSLIDVALFAGARNFGLMDAAGAVTLDLSTQFIGAGRLNEPLDAEVELLRETGRLLFMRGLVVQGEGGNHRVAAFAGTIRKAAPSK
jgi:uncharacterized protein (TIGR00369 family)